MNHGRYYGCTVAATRRATARTIERQTRTPGSHEALHNASTEAPTRGRCRAGRPTHAVRWHGAAARAPAL